MSRYVRVGGHVIYPSRWERRASPLPLLVWVFVIAFVASCLTLALSAAASLVEKPALDVAAVRADAAWPGRLGIETTATSTAAAGPIGSRPAGSASATEDPPPASELGMTRSSQLITPRDDPAAIVLVIRAAAIEFDQDPDELLAVARCESSLRPDVVGDHGAAIGLFQFHMFRWWLNAPSLGYHDDLRTDPVASSRVAAYAFAHGQRAAWTCAGVRP